MRISLKSSISLAQLQVNTAVQALTLEVASASIEGDGYNQEYQTCLEEIRSVAA